MKLFSILMLAVSMLLIGCAQSSAPAAKRRELRGSAPPGECSFPLWTPGLCAQANWASPPEIAKPATLEVNVWAKSSRSLDPSTRVKILAKNCCGKTIDLPTDMVRDGVFRWSTDQLMAGDWTFVVEVSESGRSERFQFNLDL